MKKKDKNLLLFALFLTFLMISIPSIFTRESQEVTNYGFNLESSQVSWNVSDYDLFIGPPIDTSPPFYLEVFRIFIDDDDPNYNWTKTEQDFEWCKGSGIEGDPYIIENLYIDAQGDGGGIYILNSDKHFIIRNCWINNSGSKEHDAAVLLRWTENGNITDNIFTYTRVGVWVEFYSSNIIVSDNYMISDPILISRAINLDNYCTDVNITRNKIFNFYSGMLIDKYVTNVTLKNNYLTNTVFKEWDAPPVRFRQVNESKVIYNTLDGVYAKTGVFVEVLSGMNNTVMNNSVISGGEFDVPDVPILSSELSLSAPDKSVLNFDDCNYNLVAHNRILSSSDTSIPGYDTLLILSLFGIVFTALAIKINLKKRH